MEPVLDKRIYNKCNRAIVVSGCARSGTTILGKILHSMAHVEYAFEPPMFFSLFAVIHKIEEAHWKLLYETYLYEEFLMKALAGRGLNRNRADDSSIYKVKPERLIEERLNKSVGKIDCEHLARESQCVYKMPDVVPFLPRMKMYYPETEIILMRREAHDVFCSLLEKRWFNEKTLRCENVIWPNRFMKGVRIPFWVEPKDDETWIKMDELQRIAYYYIRVNEPTEQIPGSIIVKYSDLVGAAEKTVNGITERLGLTWGEKTRGLIGTIKRKRKKVESNILKDLPQRTRDEVEYYSSLS
jgi:hypothetical protein